VRLLTLNRVVLVCAVRRLRRTAARAPVLAAGLMVLAFLAPYLLVRGGDRAGAAAASFVQDPRSARALLLPLLFAAAGAGATLTLLTPGERELDPQLRAAPLPRWKLVLATTIVPLALAALAVAALLLLAAVPFAAHLPAGRIAVPAALAGCAAACALGAALAEAALAASRRALHAALGLAGPAVAAAADPLEPIARAALAPAAVPDAVFRAGLVWLVASVVWLVLVVNRPPPRNVATRRPLVPLPARPAGAWFVTALARYGRRGELRHAGLAGVVFGCLAAALIGTSSTGGSALVLGSMTALLGACAFPLAQHGLDLRARWLWFSARGTGGVAPAAGAVAAAALAAATVAVGAVPVAVATDVAGESLGGVAVAVGAGIGVALVAGAVLPWRGDRLSDQLSSFGVFVGLSLCSSFAVGAIAEPALAVLPDPLFAAAVLVATFGIAVVLATRSFRRLE
jgi:hypothetical protein